ncbi:von Willebrand factor type A domain-containing protein [Vibrio nigripulchritudo ATCC 27043]|uniref:hypothetical protein n=1 Tax=Vibrio nigripulchritudo TaxID=28173 RepID=UPI00021C2E51|nr:hypothetical protein [Vibrio nigripulchritudo]EGU53103.1 von Willebrand factor type A domain-containing protein [Vibrio nigripulchritudo ATCC 27043]
MAYQQAQKGFIKGGINRVILATDGDFNVGETNMDTLKDLITKEKKKRRFSHNFGFWSWQLQRCSYGATCQRG